MEINCEEYRRKLERTEKYLYDFLNAYRTYHNHKERMAYVSFVVYLGFFASALLAGTWPFHHEISISDNITIIIITAIWLFALVFLKWQLRLRRIAAIYVAAAQEVLASFLSELPLKSMLEPNIRNGDEINYSCVKRLTVFLGKSFFFIIDYVWPVDIHKYIAVDVNPDLYPYCLSQAITERFKKGTGAIFHERLLVLLGWSVYIGIIARVVLLTE